MVISLSRYNLALIPNDKTLADTCIALAQANLRDIANEYLLGDEALPHVTLSQFKCPPEELDNVWLAMAQLQHVRLLLQFDHVYIQRGTQEHRDFNWIGLTVQPNRELSDLQRSVLQNLKFVGIEGITFRGEYFPHLTWARCASTATINISSLPSDTFWAAEYEFRFSLGHSSENGVYRKCLLPSSF